MKIAIIAVTRRGEKVAAAIKKSFPGSRIFVPSTSGAKAGRADGLSCTVRRLFTEYEGIVFCTAMGIAVRVIAPCLESKYRDPAVVVVDGQARFAISTLSGHEGGANDLAIRVGNVLGAEPVITTASESGKKVVVGIGCMRGVRKEMVVKALRYALERARCSMGSVRCIATIDLKQNEPGLKKACLELGIPLRIISFDTVKKFGGSYRRSAFVKQKIGVEGVSEPCALLAAKNPQLILPKRKVGKVTVAVVKEH